MLIDVIVGTRPNFMKAAALFTISDRFPELNLRLIHTGQHYDTYMSDVFLRELNLPEPTLHLGVGSGTHGAQTAEIMHGYEKWVMENRPDVCVVVGDVNSTVACALVAVKVGITVAHIEAGLRSFDRAMPEEINRVVTDSISDLMFATEQSGMLNLARENRPVDAIYLVGDVMIDTLLRMKPRAAALRVHERYGADAGSYAYVTLHRPANVDEQETLAAICEQLCLVADRLPVIFPVHPRTASRLQNFALYDRLARHPHITLVEPVSYLESLSLTLDARMVITDSGGLQAETSALGIPCLTLRDTAEHLITLREGTNQLVGHNWALLHASVDAILQGRRQMPDAPPLYWDGKAGERILRILAQHAADQ